MATRRVRASGVIGATADRAWAKVSDFCAPWHPAVAEMSEERTPAGHVIRSFTVEGDDTRYKERLTYLSHSERQMRYTHLEGISGADRYEATLAVRAREDGGAVVEMRAEIDAAEPRCREIAEGTQWVFDTGVKALALDLDVPKGETRQRGAPDVPLVEATVEGAPKLALTATAKGHDTLVLFLHGIGGNRSNWTAQLHAVAPYARAAALDLRGYGDSALGQSQSNVDAYCADILRACDALGAKRLILCGLSYGAWIATSFAMRHPEILAGLVLSGGCTGMSEAGAAEREAFRKSREVPLDAGQTPADFAPAVVEVIAGPGASADVRAALTKSMQDIPAATYRDALRCFTNPMEKFDFSKLSTPTLLITGEHDRLAPPTEIGAVAERIWQASETPDVQFEVLSGAGHVCNLEAPEDYNGYLVPFVKRIA